MKKVMTASLALLMVLGTLVVRTQPAFSEEGDEKGDRKNPPKGKFDRKGPPKDKDWDDRKGPPKGKFDRKGPPKDKFDRKGPPRDKEGDDRKEGREGPPRRFGPPGREGRFEGRRPDGPPFRGRFEGRGEGDRGRDMRPPMGPPRFGTILPPPVRERLQLSDQQNRELDALERSVRERLERLLTPEQLRQLERFGPPQGKGPPRESMERDRRGPKGPPPDRERLPQPSVDEAID